MTEPTAEQTELLDAIRTLTVEVAEHKRLMFTKAQQRRELLLKAHQSGLSHQAISTNTGMGLKHVYRDVLAERKQIVAA